MSERAGPLIRALTETDLDRALALSAAAGWNQTEHDWRFFIQAGQAWGIIEDQVLAASAAVLPFGNSVAWVSMVLTLPQQRRRGFGTALLSHALAELRASGHRAVLDATPLGEPFYAALGFSPLWTFRRWRLAAGGPLAQDIRPLREADWPALLGLDHAACGVGRAALLRSIAARIPQAGFVAPSSTGIDGFVLARDGRIGPQIGPVVARDAETARRLIASALSALTPGTPVVIDIADRHAALAEWLASLGAEALRPFTRMALGDNALPSHPSLLVAPVGPEFG